MDISSRAAEGPWEDVQAIVVGFGPEGQAAADTLLYLGAEVVVVDPVAAPEHAEFRDLLRVLGATFIASAEEIVDLPDELMVVTTGETAQHSVLTSLTDRAEQPVVLSTLDLARHREPDQVWFLIGAADTNDERAHVIAHATAVLLNASGIRAAAAGAGAQPALELVMEPERYEVLVVAVTPQLLAESGALRPQSSCLLIDEPGLGAVFADVERACVYKPAVAATEEMVAEADVVEGARAIGITLGTPAPSMLGVVEDVLCDRAFVENRRTSAAEICTLDDLARSGDEAVECLLAAVALTRAYGVAIAEIRSAISENF